MKRPLLALSLLLTCAPLHAADPVKEVAHALPADALGTGRLVPDAAFTTLGGESGKLSAFVRNAPLTVVALTSITCPLCKKYAPTLAALEDEWKPRGVQFLYVNPLDADDPAGMTADAKARGFDGPYAAGDTTFLTTALQAQTTTEVFVLDAARTLLYRGAVDDQYGLGYQKDAPAVSWLSDALSALTDGRRPVVAATTAPGCAMDQPAPAAGNPDAPALTWHGRVSRIVQNRCQDCHHTGGVAPFALESREDVIAHAGMIRKVIERGVMPPWYAAPADDQPRGHWANDRSLSEDDRRDLLTWLAGDRAEGDPALGAAPRAWPDGWAIGTPDAVIPLPREVAVKATGRMDYIDMEVKTDYAEDRWVKALEVRPTALAQVHHVLVFVVPKEFAGKRKTGEGEDFFAAYVPGSNRLEYPDGYAKRLPAGASLVFQLHYTPNGTAAVDRTQLGLRFAPEPPRREVKVAATKAPRLRIPPGDPDYKVSADLPVPFDAEILAFMPHMHVRGKAYRYEIVTPDGDRRTVLDVPHYDFNWQLLYRLAQPLRLPAGSRITGTAWYDNSAGNPANPDPSKTVRWGLQTEDEMMLGYLEYVRADVTVASAGDTPISLTPKALGLLGQRLDADKDGRISAEEAGPAFRKLHQQLDLDQDGYVTRQEVMTALARRRG